MQTDGCAKVLTRGTDKPRIRQIRIEKKMAMTLLRCQATATFPGFPCYPTGVTREEPGEFKFSHHRRTACCRATLPCLKLRDSLYQSRSCIGG